MIKLALAWMIVVESWGLGIELTWQPGPALIWALILVLDGWQDSRCEMASILDGF
jgi:hypothetical protein